MWNAARRLAWLVAVSLGLVATPFVADARIGALPAAAAGIAVALLAIAAIPMLRARRFLRRAGEVSPVAPPGEVYRTSARQSADAEPDESGATREAVIAFLLLSMAGALTIVAAASR
jgi:hypothetical protein